MATVSRHTYRGANIYLTSQQWELIQLIERRASCGLPAVQRDFAEALGVRRDSLNKLLARTRRTLARQGVALIMPPRARSTRAMLGSFDAIGTG